MKAGRGSSPQTGAMDTGGLTSGQGEAGVGQQQDTSQVSGSDSRNLSPVDQMRWVAIERQLKEQDLRMGRIETTLQHLTDSLAGGRPDDTCSHNRHQSLPHARARSRSRSRFGSDSKYSYRSCRSPSHSRSSSRSKKMNQKKAGKQKVSLLNKYLTDDVREWLSERTTKYGGDLALCIKSGIELPDSSVGVYATDPDAFNIFNELFNPIIAEYHRISPEELSHPQTNFGDPDHPDLDLSSSDTQGRIISTRVRVARSLDGFAFSNLISSEDRLEVGKRVEKGLQYLPPHLAGSYHHLSDIGETEQLKMVKDHVLYKYGDRYLDVAGSYRDWPNGRGIFNSNDNNLIVWVNEEDHMRIISLSKGSDLTKVYKTIIETVQTLEKCMEFAHSPEFGYLSMCPTNLGTTLRASVLVSLPRLSQLANFKSICAEMGLDVRGTHGEHTEAENGVYDISNKRRMGLTEWDAVSGMVRGVRILLLLEDSL